MDKKPNLRVGFMSGLNYGSDGCRMGLWELAADIFKKEKVNYVVLAGGLVDQKGLKEKLNVLLRGAKKDEREALKKKFIVDVAKTLKENIPTIPGVSIYVVTSPAYDGKIGEDVARILTEARADIMLYRQGGDRLELLQLGNDKHLGVYVPKKGVWMRGDYYDTPGLRVLKDEKKRSTRGIGDIIAVGCMASAVFNPGDSSDIKKPYFLGPVLYKIDETRTAENQTGIAVLDFQSPNPKEATARVYSFKDLVSDEWLFVEAPPGSSKIQEQIIEKLKQCGPLTVGLLHHFTDFERKDIVKAMEGLLERRSSTTWPGLYKDASKRYSFHLDWFQEKLRYKLPKGEVKVDSFLGWGCLHAGCKHTDMRFFRDIVPQLILDNDVKYLIGAGDFIEGLKHDLLVLNEVVGSRRYTYNYTKQERLSAYLVASVMIKVFRARADKALKQKGVSKFSQKELAKIVRDSMPDFIYIAGNHCGWTEPLGFDALSTFRSALKDFLSYFLSQMLDESGVCLNELNALVQGKLIHLSQRETHVLPSGLTVSLLHPSMSRTKTTSIRPQEMLANADSQVVFGANFHVAESVAEWGLESGQRICLQFGTVKRSSGFENTKMKIVDFGVGFLKVTAIGNRIKTTETAFYSTPTANLTEANNAILEEFEKLCEEMKL